MLLGLKHKLCPHTHMCTPMSTHASLLCVSGGAWKPLDPVTRADISRGQKASSLVGPVMNWIDPSMSQKRLCVSACQCVSVSLYLCLTITHTYTLKYR